MATLLWHPSLGVVMGSVARSFDACLVCMVHACAGQTVRKPAALRLGMGG